MPGIFISYRRTDSQSAAGRLADSLEERIPDAKVFRDVETIEAGADFVDAITSALKSCDVLLAVVGPRWLDVTDAQGHRRLDDPRDYTRLELATALERKDVRVIPVLVDGAAMPAAEALPDDLKPLARRNAIELTDKRWDYDVSQLVIVLRRDLGLPLRPDIRRWLWLCAAAVMLLAAFGYLALRHRGERAAPAAAPPARNDVVTPPVPRSPPEAAKPAGEAAASDDAGKAGPGPCPKTMSAFRDLATPFTCLCSAEGVLEGSVWGTDTYADDSRLCAAAVHAGVIGDSGGRVTVKRVAGRPLYIGSSRHGVRTHDYGQYGYSIQFAGAAPPPPGPEFCPSRLSVNRDMTTPFVCLCSAEDSQYGSVWGTDEYTDDSLLCHAAVHAGVITKSGGAVTVVRTGGRDLYPGTSRNGVTSADYGQYGFSMRFVAK